MNSLVTPLSVVCLFGIALRLNFKSRTALILALLFAFNTTAFLYARFNGNEPHLSLLLLGSFYFILRLKEKVSWGNVICLGLIISFLIMDHYAAIPLAFITVSLIFIRRKELELTRYHLFAILFMFLSSLLFCFYYNFARYGSPFITGYDGQNLSTPVYAGLFGLLFSPGKSVFLYNPLILLSLFWFRRFFRGRKNIWLYYFIIFIPLYRLLLYAHWHDWHGGLGWSSRRLLPVIPFLILPLGAALENFTSLKKYKKILIVFTIFASFLIQLLSIVVHYKYYWIAIVGDMAGLYLSRFFSFIDGPFVGQIKILVSAFSQPRYFDCFWVRQFSSHPLGVSLSILILLSIMIISIFNLKKSRASSTTTAHSRFNRS
ncbi:MAG: glycosyltransferase family 39 protein [Elusimicrobiota bacterium]|nr:glycosyltransferase family 39 protein [Elusimicrobiota bacterium]